MKKCLVLCLAVSLFFVLSADAQKKAKPKSFPTVGQFNNISMGSKSGDLAGTEIYLTQSDTETYAVVRTAAGDLSNPILVTAKVSGKDMRTIEFSIPSESEPGAEIKYKGTVTANALLINEGDSLKRTCGTGGSRTYSNITVGKESGDYGGIEVYLMNNIGEWFALVQIAEGTIGTPQLIEVKVTGDAKVVLGAITSNNGRATPTPIPLSNVRLDRGRLFGGIVMDCFQLEVKKFAFGKDHSL